MHLCSMCGKHSPPAGKNLCDVCRAYHRKMYKKYHIRNRSLVFQFYGDKCVCCGETERMFLNIDHINNDGNIQRKKSSDGGRDFYRKVAKRILAGDPPDDLQLLCRNCNWGKHVNGGVCPHMVKG